jgi:hypothetical protein
MSECPKIKYTDFKKLTAQKIKEMKSVEVISDNDTLFFAIIPPTNGGMRITDHIKTKADYLGAQGNTVGGKTPEEIIGSVPVPV